MSERVHVISRSRGSSELFLKVTLTVKALTRKALARGHITVGLNEPPAYNNKSSLFYSFLYLFEHFRIKILYPFITLYKPHGIRISVYTSLSRINLSSASPTTTHIFTTTSPSRKTYRFALLFFFQRTFIGNL